MESHFCIQKYTKGDSAKRFRLFFIFVPDPTECWPMIKYQQFDLDNGLKVLVHEDKSTPLAVVNITYNVGSRDEDPRNSGGAEGSMFHLSVLFWPGVTTQFGRS